MSGGILNGHQPPLAVSGGVALGLAGLSFVGVGVWARRTVAEALARERIVSTGDARPPNARVTSAAAARSMAEVIRVHTLEATNDRTYAEVEQFLDSEGLPTSDADAALKDPQTGRPVENPARALWLQATTLQTALMQAYLAFRLADLTIAVGGSLVVAGAGLAATGAARR